jgi:peptidoglycan hydrolase-like protein with peptidoglycan-binding domain/sporulation protein YlmC with PRC-barrel domain
MRRTAVVLLSSLALLAPAVAMAANQAVAVDTKVLTNAKVERNGKHVGTVQRVMVDPTSGRITHLDILMTEGQQRLIAVPWSGVRLFQDNGGNMTVSLTSRAASEASPSASPSTSASMPAPTSDVAAAQQRLKDRGYYGGPVDGVIGPNTEAALRAYQRDQRLAVTGKLDSQTLRALTTDTSTAATRAVPSAASAMDIRSAQRELKGRGYYSGPVDGVLGARTDGALRAYQRDHGLKVTGRLDSPTVRSLTS